MKIVEYRIPLPYSQAEYQIGQLYSIAILSKEESGGGEGVEVVKNEPFENEKGKGQYTYKIYHVSKRLPTWLAKLLPSSTLDFHEESWNAFPYCRTVVTSPFFGKKFKVEIVSLHKDADYGQTENIHGLPPEILKKRKVVLLDIANDTHEHLKKEEDPRVYTPSKVQRGPLKGTDWYKKQQTVMCCYKLVSIECKIAIIQSALESKLHETQKGLFLRVHQKLFCTTDDWINLTIQEIRSLEEQIREELRLAFEQKQAEKAAKANKKNTKASSSSSSSLTQNKQQTQVVQ
jgi:hypothetical protein